MCCLSKEASRGNGLIQMKIFITLRFFWIFPVFSKSQALPEQLEHIHDKMAEIHVL